MSRAPPPRLPITKHPDYDAHPNDESQLGTHSQLITKVARNSRKSMMEKRGRKKEKRFTTRAREEVVWRKTRRREENADTGGKDETRGPGGKGVQGVAKWPVALDCLSLKLNRKKRPFGGRAIAPIVVNFLRAAPRPSSNLLSINSLTRHISGRDCVVSLRPLRLFVEGAVLETVIDCRTRGEVKEDGERRLGELHECRWFCSS